MIRKYKQHPWEQPQKPADPLAGLREQVNAMDPEQLAAFAAERGIQLGNATSEAGIRKKILESLEAQHKGGQL